MIVYPVITVVKDQTQQIVVSLFTSADVPVLGAVGGDLSADFVNLAGVTNPSIGGVLTPWTELSDGYYRLGLDGLMFFNQLGWHQLDLVHATAVRTRFVFNVVAVDPAESVFYDVVRDSLGNPIPDVEVAVYEHLTVNNLYTTRTYTNGEFSIPLSAVDPIVLVDLVFSPVGQPSFRRDGVLLT